MLTVEEVLRLADHGLYLAKNRGRNQATGILPKSAMPRPADRRYTKLEHLLQDAWICETCTAGSSPAGTSSDGGASSHVSAPGISATTTMGKG